MYKKYIIQYEIHLKSGEIIKNKEIKINNCTSNIGSQIKLEEYLIRKYKDFKQLIVNDCSEDYLSGFEDLFGKKNFGNFGFDGFGKKNF